jgi:pimeloyl-ACP methyl ester carboxylesterase
MKSNPNSPSITPAITYGNLQVNGVNIAYREAGALGSPQVVLLHGFPSSSHQYRHLVASLADKFHVIAPDYPGFGNSDYPDPSVFAYTFDNISEIVGTFLKMKGFVRFGMYVQDYGGPVGMRIVGKNPEQLEWLIVQNSNTYLAGWPQGPDGVLAAWKGLWNNRSPETENPLAGFFTREPIKSFYMFGAKNPERISPDNWEMDAAMMQHPHSRKLNLDLFFDYQNNFPLYPQWQAFLKKRQPKTLILWAQKDCFFLPEGGEAYLADLPNAELHRIDAGHFVLEEQLDKVTNEMKRFYDEKVAQG